MGFYIRHTMNHRPVNEVTNWEAKRLLSQRHPFDALPLMRHSNLAFAA